MLMSALRLWVHHRTMPVEATIVPVSPPTAHAA
jgi:hypothetical protein